MRSNLNTVSLLLNTKNPIYYCLPPVGEAPEKYNNPDNRHSGSSVTQQPAVTSSNPLDKLDFSTAEFRAGVDSLADKLQVRHHTNIIVCFWFWSLLGSWLFPLTLCRFPHGICSAKSLHLLDDTLDNFSLSRITDGCRRDGSRVHRVSRSTVLQTHKSANSFL